MRTRKSFAFLATTLLVAFMILQKNLIVRETRVLETTLAAVDQSAKKTVPLSIVVPLDVEDWIDINGFLTSLKNQTVLPLETIIVVSGPQNVTEFLKEPDERQVKNLPIDVSFFYTKEWNRQEIARSFESTWRLLQEIPNVKIFSRNGKHYAGSNRVYGYEAVSDATEVVSFFDGDDYMHPQRTEMIYSIFQEVSDLHAVLHQQQFIKHSNWNSDFPYFLGNVFSRDELRFQYTYEEIKNAIPDFDGLKWDLNDWRTEPNWPEHQKKTKFKKGRDWEWWFPRMTGLDIKFGNNGWLSVRKHVLMEVPYPDLPLGEDSLFNYRLLKTPGLNMQFLPALLGAYSQRE